MRDVYSVLIKRDAGLEITAYYYPDFEYTYPLLNATTTGDSVPDSTVILMRYVDKLKAQHVAIPFPKPLENFQQTKQIDSGDQWSICCIDMTLRSGWWESVLPKFGIFSSVMTAATMAMIDFLTIKTSVTSTTGTSLGTLGAIYSGLMTLIIYYFSNASDFSRQAGRYVDNRLNGLQPLLSTPTQKSSSFISMLMKALLTTLPVFTTLITSYTHFNQVGAIGEKLHRGDFFSKAAFNSVNIVMIIFSVYSKFFFQISFLPKLYNRIDDKFQCSVNSLNSSGVGTLFTRFNYSHIEEGKCQHSDDQSDKLPFSMAMSPYEADSL